MTTAYVTITSKNQITLPADYVRRLKLTKNRRLEVRETKGKLELKPELSLDERMAPIWAEMAKQRAGRKPLTDDELNRAARDAYAASDAAEHRW